MYIFIKNMNLYKNMLKNLKLETKKIQLSTILPRISIKNNLYDMHYVSKKRIESHINKFKGTGHVNEYNLMNNFESNKILPYIIGVEYEIDDGIKIDHSGDLLCYDGIDKLLVVELKCIKLHENKKDRLVKVKNQAYKLSKRLLSWKNHIVNINESLEYLKNIEVVPSYFTDESYNLEYL